MHEKNDFEILRHLRFHRIEISIDSVVPLRVRFRIGSGSGVVDHTMQVKSAADEHMKVVLGRAESHTMAHQKYRYARLRTFGGLSGDFGSALRKAKEFFDVIHSHLPDELRHDR